MPQFRPFSHFLSQNLRLLPSALMTACGCQLSAPLAEAFGYGLRVLLYSCCLLDAFHTPIDGLSTSLASLFLVFVHLLNHKHPLPRSRPRPCHDGSSSLIPNSPLPDNRLIKTGSLLTPSLSLHCPSLHHLLTQFKQPLPGNSHPLLLNSAPPPSHTHLEKPQQSVNQLLCLFWAHTQAVEYS